MAPLQTRMGTGNPRIGDDEFAVPDSAHVDRQLEGTEHLLLVAPGQVDFLPQRIATRRLAHGVDVALHGDEIRRLVLVPLHLVDVAGLDPPAHADGSQRTVADAIGPAGIVESGTVGPDFVRTRQIAQARGHVDGIAIAVAVHGFDLASRHADPDGEVFGQRLLQQVHLVLALQVNDCVNSGCGVAEHRQHAITEGLDDLSAMCLQDVADPVGQLCHRPGSPGIAEGLENGGAAGQISENDGGVDTHARTGLIFLLAV